MEESFIGEIFKLVWSLFNLNKRKTFYYNLNISSSLLLLFIFESHLRIEKMYDGCYIRSSLCNLFARLANLNPHIIIFYM